MTEGQCCDFIYKGPHDLNSYRTLFKCLQSSRALEQCLVNINEYKLIALMKVFSDFQCMPVPRQLIAFTYRMKSDEHSELTGWNFYLCFYKRKAKLRDYMQTMTARELRRKIRKDLPPEAFDRDPFTLVLLFASNAVIAACYYISITYELGVLWRFLLAFLIGHQFFLLGIIAHDIMHGAVVKDMRLRVMASRFGFYPFFFSPYLWDVWHTKSHHGNLYSSRDPDAALSAKECEENFMARWGVKLMPSRNNRIVGSLFYLYWFTLVGQVNLWFNNRFKHWRFEEYRFKRKLAIRDVLLYLAIWVCVGYLLGPYHSLFLIILPMMVGNIIFMIYATSEHVYLPQSYENNPLDNTVSVTQPRVVDMLTLNFSHHVEHHLFPSMSFRKTPLVREWLRRNVPHLYMDPTLGQALRVVFSTPRIYEDPNYLVSSTAKDGFRVDVRELRDSLRKADSENINEVLRTGGGE